MKGIALMKHSMYGKTAQGNKQSLKLSSDVGIKPVTTGTAV